MQQASLMPQLSKGSVDLPIYFLSVQVRYRSTMRSCEKPMPFATAYLC